MVVPWTIQLPQLVCCTEKERREKQSALIWHGAAFGSGLFIYLL